MTVTDWLVRRMPPLSTRCTDGFVAAGCAFLVFLALVLNFLRFQQYPLLSVEAGMLILIFGGIALIFGALYDWPGLAGRAVLEAGLLTYAASISLDSAKVLAMAAIAIAVLVVAIRRSILPFVSIMAAISIAAGTLGIGQQYQPVVVHASRVGRIGEFSPHADDEPRPALVHLILDEHIGIEGLPRDNSHSPALRKELIHFYLSRGFRLFGRATSEQYMTYRSIPQLLNLGVIPPRAKRASKTSAWKPERSAYLDAIRRAGYRLHILQADFMDLCGIGHPLSCTTYTAQSYRGMYGTELPLGDKVRILLANLAPRETLMMRARALQQRLAALGLPVGSPPETNRVHQLNARREFDGLIRDLAKAKPGHAYLAHLLLPHNPYSLRPDCTLTPFSHWMGHPNPAPVSISRRHMREDAYFDQIRCITRKIGAAVAALDRSPARGTYLLIVHGDHGSRIVDRWPVATNLGRLSYNDMTAAFSTLFAVRGPQIKSGYDSRPVFVGEMLRGLVASDFTNVPDDGQGTRPTVLLDAARQRPATRVPMPESWYTGGLVADPAAAP